MNLFLKRHKRPKNVKQTNMREGASFAKKSRFGGKPDNPVYFSWGRVLARHSSDMTVDVKIESGIELKHVFVSSKSWVGVPSGTTTAIGERDLPPIDSLVLIVFPYGRTDEGLVLCSSFTNFSTLGTALKSELMVTSKETEKLKIEESGVKETQDKTTGNYKIEVKSGATYEISVNNATIIINADGSVNVTAAATKAMTINSGAQNCNNLPVCLFSGAPHGTNATVKVPYP